MTAEIKPLPSSSVVLSVQPLKAVDFSLLLPILPQQGAQSAASEDVGFLSRGGPEGPGRTRTLPQVPGVRVQLGKPAVS